MPSISALQTHRIMRGRKPKPTFLKLVEGNPGHRPLNHAEPEPDGDLVDAPDELSEAERRMWARMLKNAPEGMLRRLDEAVFASYVVNYCTFLEANAEVTKLGRICKVNGAEGINPNISIARNANAAMLKAAAELGFSPSSRSRVKVPRGKKKSSVFGRLKELSAD
jgi:P27 family predicted phage terminase small subunit